MNTKQLTPKQQRFAENYLIDLNATQAAIRAGYSKKTAQQMSSEILLKPVVQARIQELMEKRSERTQITQDMVVKELAKAGFSNMRDYAEWGPSGVTLIDSDELKEEQAAIVSEVSETVTQHGGTIRCKLHDKIRALELLGKHLGIFKEEDKSTGDIYIYYVGGVKKPDNAGLGKSKG